MAAEEQAVDVQVVLQQRAALGVILLNRPQALNSLTIEMLERMASHYAAWKGDTHITAVLIKGAGGKAFCAGGDVKKAAQHIREGRPEEAKSFFRNEYELNHSVGSLEKPHIALMDGITMGGGAGLSIHGAFRIATERSVFAMPECSIGLFPDVGASHFLNALPGQLGMYLALTGSRLKGYQLVEAGLATHLVASQSLRALEDRLVALGPAVGDTLQLESVFTAFQAEACEHTAASGLLDSLPGIDECFQHDSVEAVLASLEGRQKDSWAAEALRQMQKASPLSLRMTLKEIRAGRGRSLAECLEMEYRLAAHVVDGPSDFAEGVRALLVDKDRKPSWKPPSLGQVTAEMTDRLFAPLPPHEELQLGLAGVSSLSRL